MINNSVCDLRRTISRILLTAPDSFADILGQVWPERRISEKLVTNLDHNQ